jgi:hypothetical protein
MPVGFSGPSPVETGSLMNPDDYNRHIAFQKSFPYRPLNQEPNTFLPEALKQEDYLRYYLGEDGLITGNDAYAVSEEGQTPPFPLEKLMAFLVKYNKLVTGEPTVSDGPLDNLAATTFKEWISVAFIFVFCLFDILRQRIVPKIAYKNRIPIIGDKRIAA